jgi:hypothetical protein
LRQVPKPTEKQPLVLMEEKLAVVAGATNKKIFR